jgi:hypothetical protein
MEQTQRNEYQRIYRAKNKAKINLRLKQRRLFMKKFSTIDVIERLVNQYLKKVEGERIEKQLLL